MPHAPIIVDLEEGGTCGICESTRKPSSLCDDCGDEIPELLWMGRNGYQSQTVDHFHGRIVAGVKGRQVMRRKLCPVCYIEDWKKVYPNEPIPIGNSSPQRESSLQRRLVVA